VTLFLDRRPFLVRRPIVLEFSHALEFRERASAAVFGYGPDTDTGRI